MALVLNGTDQYLNEPLSLALRGASTIAIKFKATFSASANASPLSVCNDDATATGLLGFLFFSGTGLVGRVWSNVAETTSPQLLTDDFWHSAVLVNDGIDTLSIYLDDNPVQTVSLSAFSVTLDNAYIGARRSSGSDSSVDYFFDGKLAYYRRSATVISAANAASYNSASSVAEINAVLPDGADLVSDATVSGSASALTAFGAPTYDTDDPLAATTPTITDIDGDESVYPGQSFVITGTNFGATQGTGTVDIDGVAQTVTAWSDTSITCTAVRGGNEYGTGKTLTVTTGAGTTATLAVAQEAEPNTFAVTAASPNTTDPASLWSNTVDTATGDPETVVNGDQFWVNSTIPGLAIQPDGTITADETGTFTGQFWKASEGVWGSDQTVSFTLPAEETDNWPFGKAINPIATKNWTWGSRHPMTGMRVRIFK